ncbi:MAG TPA: M20/M25/M40 family metallo-hydrolase [Gemmatimonadaceae bacterium]|nr:M20/M25/M40 family metallo-hydrolase [Gemmatimonadaceae bacterium]
MRIHRLALLALAAPAVLSAQRAGPPPLVTIPVITEPATPASARRLLSVIAADSMEGRAIWRPGSERAARYIAEQMRIIGLVPAGDSGYFQKIPGALMPNGRVMRLPRLSDLDTVPADRRRLAVNVVGVLPGSIPAGRADSVILVGAHYDHVGVGPAVNGDSIYNGADDDGSGTVAVLEIARIMKKWPAPRRTVVFMAFTGEEAGAVGTGWYVANPVRPLSSMAADFQIEMIGRPDTLGMGPGRAWLTGYERSTMGETFQRHGLGIVPDPRPSQSFFTRSDNYAFALQGIPAHTISSFNLHTDYHRPSDEVSKVDFDHMAQMINVAAKAAWILTDAPAPQWLPGQRPCPRVPGAGGRGRGGPPMTPAQQDSARLANQFPRSCGS